eukprot:CAMPEP_0114562562 /NCGR_PEP_ID=MMETSP0114-20121206/12599_1 /TAXON_ID=31324 /ORGANISM="Goniomonas sp, Strain m" /LENGTH=289 /DNA_ID=CAMNT_0001748263 /DNA_START=54 /DNA_END=923 /DNA_ORIENTATION=+
MPDYHHLLPPCWKETVVRWLKEDIPSFDYGGFVVGERQVEAKLLGKTVGVLCGKPFLNAIFESLECTVEWHADEGVNFEKGTHLATVTGAARNVLMGERTALEVMVRSTSIATHARKFLLLAQEHKWQGRIAGTRKTAPGLRLLDKYSMIVGGVDTHRMDLSSMIMLKDNHIAIAGSITRAVKEAKSVGGFALKVEVECQNEEEAVEAASAGADVVMLDNFTAENLKASSARLKQQFPHLLIEGSGGIRFHTVADFFGPGVDILSVGALSQSLDPVDLSLKITASQTPL